jgi:predicted tellurium resistance membrane protein TerC
MGINLLLSGDNAVVITRAARELPPKERFWGKVVGAGAAAVLLVLFTGIVATLMQWPYLKLAGGLLRDDPIVMAHIPADKADAVDLACGIAGAIVVVLAGLFMARLQRARPTES